MDSSCEKCQELVLGKSFVNSEKNGDFVSSCILRYEFCPASVQECSQGCLSWEPSGTVSLDFYKQGENGEPSPTPASLSGRLAQNEGQLRKNEPTSGENYILIQEEAYWRLEKVDLSVVHLRPFRSSQKAVQKGNSVHSGQSPASNRSTPVHIRASSTPCSPANKLTPDIASNKKRSVSNGETLEEPSMNKNRRLSQKEPFS
ncbi:hypothetical protein GpartN1_g602.t1 [Galdieria partita]|uniref:Uncharacterized protein n=1 Tax=Galdieria partita TaxID=83374 RepID=A0A9C7PR15_9RHOD|nr:hypothetical protein GpartN1_g602.t1 [Galdieria partita]